LVAVADLDEPGVVFGIGVTGRQQLLQQDRDLHAIGRSERIELERMLANRQFLLVRRTGCRAIDPGKRSTVGTLRCTDFRRDVAGRTVILRRNLVFVGHAGLTGSSCRVSSKAAPASWCGAWRRRVQCAAWKNEA